MPGSAKMLLFVLLLPFFAALGHDVYFNYFSDEDRIKEVKKLQVDPTEFMISDLGWIWKEYSPDTMELVQDTVGQEKWESNYDPILKQPSMLVTAVPAMIGAAYLLIAFIIGFWPFSRFGRGEKGESTKQGVYKKAKTNAVKYTKK